MLPQYRSGNSRKSTVKPHLTTTSLFGPLCLEQNDWLYISIATLMPIPPPCYSDIRTRCLGQNQDVPYQILLASATSKSFCCEQSWVRIYRECFKADNKECFTAVYSFSKMTIKQFRADGRQIRDCCVYKVSIKSMFHLIDGYQLTALLISEE